MNKRVIYENIYRNIDKLPTLGEIVNKNKCLTFELNLFFSNFYSNIGGGQISFLKYSDLENYLKTKNEDFCLLTAININSLLNYSNDIICDHKNDIVWSIQWNEKSNSIETTSLADFFPKILKKFKFLVNLSKPPRNNVERNIDLIDRWDEIITNGIFDIPGISARVSIPQNMRFTPRYF